MQDGMVYVMIPADLDTCTVVAKITPLNYETVDTLAITYDEHIQASLNPANPNSYGTEKPITVGAEKDTCNLNSVCESWETESCGDCSSQTGIQYQCFTNNDCTNGETCYSGVCSSSPPVCDYDSTCDSGESSDSCSDCTGPNPNPGCCAGFALFAVMGICLAGSMFVRRRA